MEVDVVNFRELAAAEYMSVSRALLRKMRKAHCGPAYVRINRTIIYRKADLDEFLERQVKRPEDGAVGGRLSHSRPSGAHHDQ
jgi:hypothetical protein